MKMRTSMAAVATVVLLVLCSSSYRIDALDIVTGCRVTCVDNSPDPPPVCGSDGVTYGSQCLLLAMQCRDPNITKAHDGQCVPPLENAPADLPSTTTASSSVLPPQFDRPCARDCNQLHMELCGADNVTYRNPCHFGTAKCEDPQLTLAHIGACFVTLPPRPRFCDTKIECSETQHKYAPTCGSNGVTYSSDCEFKIAYCSDVQASLAVVHEGPCK